MYRKREGQKIYDDDDSKCAQTDAPDVKRKKTNRATVKQPNAVQFSTKRWAWSVVTYFQEIEERENVERLSGTFTESWRNGKRCDARIRPFRSNQEAENGLLSLLLFKRRHVDLHRFGHPIRFDHQHRFAHLAHCSGRIQLALETLDSSLLDSRSYSKFFFVD